MGDIETTHQEISPIPFVLNCQNPPLTARLPHYFPPPSAQLPLPCLKMGARNVAAKRMGSIYISYIISSDLNQPQDHEIEV